MPANLLGFSLAQARELDPRRLLNHRLRTPLSVWKALRWSGTGLLCGVPFVAYSASRAAPGEMLAETAAGAAALASYPVLAGGTAAALSLSLPVLPPAAAAFAGLVLAAYPALAVERFASRQFRRFSVLGERVRRVEMGGDYRDSATAQALRFSAVRDMSSALPLARRFLGREALIFNQ